MTDIPRSSLDQGQCYVPGEHGEPLVLRFVFSPREYKRNTELYDGIGYTPGYVRVATLVVSGYRDPEGRFFAAQDALFQGRTDNLKRLPARYARLQDLAVTHYHLTIWLDAILGRRPSIAEWNSYTPPSHDIDPFGIWNAIPAAVRNYEPGVERGVSVEELWAAAEPEPVQIDSGPPSIERVAGEYLTHEREVWAPPTTS